MLCFLAKRKNLFFAVVIVLVLLVFSLEEYKILAFKFSEFYFRQGLKTEVTINRRNRCFPQLRSLFGHLDQIKFTHCDRIGVTFGRQRIT
jgi:hypothetical protein